MEQLGYTQLETKRDVDRSGYWGFTAFLSLLSNRKEKEGGERWGGEGRGGEGWGGETLQITL